MKSQELIERDLFKRNIESLSRFIKDPNSVIQKFSEYEQVLTQYSNRFNMISHSDLNRLWIRHFWDSLMPLTLFSECFEDNIYGITNENIYFSMIDVGTGSGFPGIPISILCKNLQVTLLDSNQKKISFIDGILSKNLILKNTTTICGRAEEILNNIIYSKKFDYTCTRAFSKFPEAVRLTLPFLKKSGHSFYWASSDVSLDIPDLKSTLDHENALVLDKKDYILEDNTGLKRSIVLICKR